MNNKIALALLSTLINAITLRKEILNTEDIERCSYRSGIYNIMIRISVEEEASLTISEQFVISHGIPAQITSVTILYFNTIINELNQMLIPFGVQLIADYRDFVFENLPVLLDTRECSESDAIIKKTEHMSINYKLRRLSGTGFRLFVFYCPFINKETKIWSHAIPVRDCGVVLGIMYHNPQIMRQVIINEILKSLAREYNIDDINLEKFNLGLCNYTHECLSVLSNFLGGYGPLLMS
ncbi:hypothetical protein EDEG_03776, partial [Edhazardia aedis USNM 41457]